MIFFIEGVSASGKTTLINEILKLKPHWIRFKGAGQVNIGIDERWEEYNFYMHNIIERLDCLNEYKLPILWDRGITEGVYSNEKWIRLAKSHANKRVIYIKSSNTELTRRSTKEGLDLELHQKQYDIELQKFQHYIFDNADIDVHTMDFSMLVEPIIRYIESEIWSIND